MPNGRHRSRGFAYLLLLVAVAVIGVASAGVTTLGAVAQRREAERQLLVVGLEIQRALRSYAGATALVATAQVQGPRTLDELLKDPRVPGLRRHLRRVWDDPLTGSDQWGTVTNAAGQIVGVYSLAPGQPIQQKGFDVELAGFEDARTYREWVFGWPR